MSKKNSVVSVILILGFLFTAAFHYTVFASDISNNRDIITLLSENGKLYINLDNVILSEGYYISKKTENIIVYKKEKTNILPEIIIKFNFENNTAYKNRVNFAIKDSIKLIDNIIYIEKEKIESILNIHITVVRGEVTVSPLGFAPHSWIKAGNGLVAHAGGSLGNTNPPNCLESVIYSYQNGHRVFEIDFNLTTDGKLAAVHDWSGYSGMKSSSEWKDVKIWGAFTSMMLEDVLDIMLVNKDMFVITDTKSFEYTQKQIEEQFKILVEAAGRKDPSLELLDRIIPQIYNQPMYDTVMKAYKFKSIIYTLYESPDSNSQIVNFIKEHDNIQAVTMAPARNKNNLVKYITDTGRYVYYHTINDLREIMEYKKSGIWGFYTDFVFPQDIVPEAVYSAVKISVNSLNSGYSISSMSSVNPVNGADSREIKNMLLGAYNIKGNNYFKIRDLAYILNGTEKQFEVVWSEKNNAILLTRSMAYTAIGGETSLKSVGTTAAARSSAKVFLDGSEVSFTAYSIGGENYFRLRDIGKIFDFNVTFDGSKNTIVINVSENYSDD